MLSILQFLPVEKKKSASHFILWFISSKQNKKKWGDNMHSVLKNTTLSVKKKQFVSFESETN